ncbi:orotidine-5'-phosphate decarboxylase [Atopobacter phocae]|uniref:orotidine-5'-phosphate decarboxylase n=1 Tax=Atopobacter phocae TaxID=136492 RepID=UPI000471327F|nr:orotidine-5'-phosphate decarboxylase [Atopobacter phocae]
METLFVALDFDSTEECFDFLNQFKGQSISVKIGMAEYFRSGADMIENLAQRGHHIFLDLKCHDIPNTVELAVEQLSNLPIKYLTVHALGGMTMLKAAINGRNKGRFHPKILAVTQLTSTSEDMLQQLGFKEVSMTDSTIQLAKMAYDAGVDGVVASVHEVEAIKQATDDSFIVLTPGIRMEQSIHDDQHRIATPKQAKVHQSDLIVVGRPIIKAKEPVEMYRKYLKDWRD